MVATTVVVREVYALLRSRSFGVARDNDDVPFFRRLFEHLQHDDGTVDPRVASFKGSAADAIALWKEMTGHEYGDREPAIRDYLVEYLARHPMVV